MSDLERDFGLLVAAVAAVQKQLGLAPTIDDVIQEERRRRRDAEDARFLEAMKAAGAGFGREKI